MHANRIVIGLVIAAAAAIVAAQPSDAPIAASPATSPAPSASTAAGLPATSPMAGIVSRAENLIEDIDGGQINWTTGQLIAVGEGKALGASGQQADMARRAARLVAARNAILLTGGIRVGPGGRFKDVKEATIKVDAVLEHFEEVASDFDPQTRTATVRLAVPIFGAHGVVKMFGVRLAAPARLVAPPKAPQDSGVKVIVIDARGTGFVPCLLPRIANAAGGVVFDAAQSPAFKSAQPRAPVVYVRMLPKDDQPQSAPAGKAGGVVLVTAQKSPAASAGTITLSDSDADEMMNRLATGGIVEGGQIVVVADPPSKPAATRHGQ